ncbi:MAG: hypothetical protein KBD62_35755, partial [Kofleriaceae bacterium]|nr:hypothetical protein [Kofleriaceae bacterium]
MPSVGALTVSLKAETESLRNDLNKAMGHIKALERETKRTSDSVRGAFDKIGVGGETLKRSFGQIATGILLMTDAASGAGKVGQVLEQSFGAFLTGGPLGAGVALVSGAFKLLAAETEKSGEAAKAAAKAFKDSLLAMDGQIKAVADRIQALRDEGRSIELKGLGIEVPAGTFNAEREAGRLRTLAAEEEARADTMRRLLAMQKEYDALVEKRRVQRNDSFDQEPIRETERAMQALSSRIFAVQKSNGLQVQAINDAAYTSQIAQIEEINAKRLTTAQLLEDEADQLAANAMRAAELKEKVTEVTRAVETGKTAVDGSAEAWRQLVEESVRAADAVRDWAAEARAIEEASQRQVDAAEEIVRKYENQRQIAEAVTDEERDRLEVLGEIESLLGSGRIGVDQAADVFDAMMGAKDADRARKLRDSMEREAEKAGRASGEKAGRSFSESFGSTVEVTIDPFISSVFQTIEGGLTAAIVDGITNGGRNGADIFRNIVN